MEALFLLKKCLFFGSETSPNSRLYLVLSAFIARINIFKYKSTKYFRSTNTTNSMSMLCR